MKTNHLNQKELRKEALQIYYNKSGANIYTLINSQEVATELGFKKNNDRDFLTLIQHLKDKGFIQSDTFTEERLTTPGIEEVQSGFPSFDTDNNRSMKSQTTIHNQGIIARGNVSSNGDMGIDNRNQVSNYRWWNTTWFQLLVLILTILGIGLTFYFNL